MDRHRLNEIGALALYQLLPINHESGAHAGDLQHTEAQVVIAAIEPLIREDQKRLDEDALLEARRSQLLDLYLEVQSMHEAAHRPKVHLPKGGKDAAKAEAYADVLDVINRRLDLLAP